MTELVIDHPSPASATSSSTSPDGSNGTDITSISINGSDSGKYKERPRRGGRDEDDVLNSTYSTSTCEDRINHKRRLELCRAKV